MAATKRSLVDNINRRKRAGTSRTKARSTVSPEAYAAMKEGWPKPRKASAKKKTQVKHA